MAISVTQPDLFQIFAALADLAPEADGVRERYERLQAGLAHNPLLAASMTFRLALAVEVLELAERLVREASGKSGESNGPRPGRPSKLGGYVDT